MSPLPIAARSARRTTHAGRAAAPCAVGAAFALALAALLTSAAPTGGLPVATAADAAADDAAADADAVPDDTPDDAADDAPAEAARDAKDNAGDDPSGPSSGGGSATAASAAAALLAEAGFAADAAGVQACLERFVLDEAARADVRALLAELDDDSYPRRERATRELARLPFLPRELLDGAIAAGSLELRTRAARLAEVHTPQRTDRILQAALGRVAAEKMPRLAPQVLAALPECRDNRLWETGQAALDATASAADHARLEAALASPTPLVRAAAARALARLRPEKTPVLLRPLLADPDERVKLQAARAVGNRGDTASLLPLAELLSSERLRTRWEAVEALRWLSKRRFGFRPSDPPEARAEPAARWVAWARGEGLRITLRTPIQMPRALFLVDGADLTQWQVVSGSRPVPAAGHWSVEGDVLRCEGNGQGYIRTKQKYKNYLLSLEWRMPAGSGDSGIGLMMTGDDTGDPRCLEVQLHPTNSADFYSINGFQAMAGGKRITFRSNKLHPSNERPPQEWNRLEIKVDRGNVEVTVNDLVQNKASGCPTEPGRINLRNEGSVVEFRGVALLPLDD